MFIFAFEKLEVCQESRLPVKEIYTATQQFPEKEKYGLIPE